LLRVKLVAYKARFGSRRSKNINESSEPNDFRHRFTKVFFDSSREFGSTRSDTIYRSLAIIPYNHAPDTLHAKV